MPPVTVRWIGRTHQDDPRTASAVRPSTPAGPPTVRGEIFGGAIASRVFVPTCEGAPG